MPEPDRSDPKFDPYSVSRRVRYLFAQTASLFCSVVCLAFAFLSYRNGLSLHAYSLVLFSVVMAIASVCFFLRPELSLPKWMLAITCTVLTTYLFYSGGTYGIGIIWTIITPVFCLFMLGLRSGLVLSFLNAAACGVIHAFAHFYPHLVGVVYDDGIAFSVLTIFVVVTLIVSVYEKSQNLDKKHLAERTAFANEMAEKAKSASASKSQFLMRMSHEIRTPLNAVLGMADLLEESPLSPEQMNFLRILQSSGQHLLGVINDILNYSGLEAHRIQLVDSPFDVHDAAEKCSQLIAVRALEKSIEVAFSLSPDVPQLVNGDELRFKQIIINLMGNAVKFTEHGCVSLELDVDANARLRIVVRDTGIGIPPEIVPHLFQRFSQADSSIMRRYGGTGLGLAITREIVDLMGGEIHVDSQIGKGSTFTVCIPVKRVDSASVQVASSSPASGTPGRDEPLPPLRILLAEDMDVNRDMVKFFLARHPVDIVEAVNGLEARDLCARSTFDVVLMDIEMPKMDGLSAIVAIRENEAAARREPVPIYALTAHALKEQIDQCIAAGAQKVITKPVGKRELVETLRQLASSRVLSASPSDESPADPPLDDERLVREFDGDAVMAHQLLHSFLDKLPAHLDEIRVAIGLNQFEELRRAAHKIKGAAANLAAVPLSAAAADLESAARAGDFAECNRFVSSLQSACNRLVVYASKLENPSRETPQ